MKINKSLNSKSGRLIIFTAWLSVVYPAAALSQNLVWNNGAATGNWNTTDANWSSLFWANGPGENALFTNTTVGGVINLSEPITAGSVIFGSVGFNTTNITFINSALQASSLTVQGKSNNNGTYLNNPTLTIGNSVAIAGNVSVGRANLIITNGTFTASQIISAAGSADWADVVVTNATVWVTNGIFGSANTTATFQLDLNGGTLYTPYLNLADRELGGGNSAWFNWNGGTVVATADTNAFISLYGGSQNIYVGNGGAIINTFDGVTAHTITIGVILTSVATSTGGLTKLGAGTLILTNANTYLGDTIVNGGKLEVVQPALATNSSIWVTNGAVLKLDFGTTNTVSGLVLNGVHQLSGVYNSNTSPAYLAGPGSLQVGATATITLTPGSYHQQMFGIGGNFCQGDQSTLISYGMTNQVFSPQGLNLSFIRLGNTYNLTEAVFTNMASDNNAVIKAFRAMQPSGKITMTAWSPPGSLKSTGSAFQGTLAKVAGQYVYSNYANWWLSSLQYYQSNSSVPDYISIQNEADWYPTGSTNLAYEAGCELDATEGTHAGYPQALAAVVSAFQSNGFGGVKFIGPDTSGIDGNVVPNYINSITNYFNTVTNPLFAVAHHLYGANAATTGVGALATLEGQYPWWVIPKFMTELNPGDSLGTNEPDWMGLAVTMHNVFTYEEANTYLVWSIMWNTINPYNGQPAGTKTYYPLGHFSKFIRPGDWHVYDTCTDTNLLVSLYRHDSGAGVATQLILVIINTAAYYSYPTIQVSNYWAADPLQRSWQVYKTANDGAVQQRLTLTENLAGASLAGDRSLEIAPYSITTVVINTGVYTNAPPVFTSSAGNQTINPGQMLVVSNTATDPNLPAQTLTYSQPIAPTNAVLNVTNGLLNWRPLIAQANTTNPFSIVVADNGSPSMSATQNFTVTVRSVTLPVTTTTAMTNEQFQMVVNGAIGPDYTMQASSNLVTWTNLFTTNPAVLPFNWLDAASTNFNQRFYRVLLGP